MTDIYIDPSSPTNGAGTEADPKNTWVGLTWVAGNRYLQKRGTTFVSASGSGGRIAPSASGTSTSRIVLSAYGDAAAPLPIIQSLADTGINLDQRSYITVELLDISGTTVSAIGGGGAAASPMAGIIVRYCRVRDTSNMGMSFQTQLDRRETIDLQIHDNELVNPGYHGIHCMGEHVNTRVFNNRISGGGLLVPGHGISAIPHRATITPTWTLVSGTIYSTPIGAQSYKTTVSAIYGVRYANGNASLIRNTATPTAPASGEFGFSGGLLYINIGGVPSGQIIFAYTSLQVLVYDNQVRDYGNASDSESKGIQFDDLASDCQALRNVIWNPRAEGIAVNMGQRNLIAANVVINPRDQGIRADINGAKNNLVYANTLVAGTSTQAGQSGIQLGVGNTAKNNLVVGFAAGISGAAAACIAAHNAFWQCAAATSGTLSDQGGNVTADPLLDTSYRPQYGSPLIGAGLDLDITSDARSAAFKTPPAIGAYESWATSNANLLLAYPNRVDEAVLSSSVAWQATLPLTHLQDRVLSRVARSTGVGIAPDIALDLQRARRIGAVALARHNLSVGARVRVRGDDAADMVTPIYDSGWVDVWPAGMIPLELLEWEDDNFWLGTVSEETRAGYNAPFVHLFEGAYARYWRVDIDDPLNADGWVQIGRLVIADTWVPEVNYSYGAQLGFEDRSVVMETIGGTEYFDARAKFRTQRLSLDWLSESEALNAQLDMQRLLGVTGELLIVPNPADTVNLPRTAFLGRVSRLAPIERSTPGIFRTNLEVKELL